MRSRIYALLSVPAFGILYLFTTIMITIILIPVSLRWKSAVRVLSGWWARTVFVLIGKRFRVYGRDNLIKNQKYILVANHASLFDIVAIMSFYPGISWFGHERLLRVPVFSKILKLTDYVPFSEPTVANTKRMMEQLIQRSKTNTVAIFPEGTRTLDGRINGFYKGFIYLFRTSDLDILPVTLNGFYKLKPKNRFYISFDSPLEVVIHKAIKREDLLEKNDQEIIESVKSTIQSAYN